MSEVQIINKVSRFICHVHGHVHHDWNGLSGGGGALAPSVPTLTCGDRDFHVRRVSCRERHDHAFQRLHVRRGRDVHHWHGDSFHDDHRELRDDVLSCDRHEHHATFLRQILCPSATFSHIRLLCPFYSVAEFGK